MIRDDDGDPMTYWPISGLKEGHDSQHIFVRIDTPTEGVFASNASDDLKIMARVADSGDPFTDLALGEIDLSGLPDGETRFEIYAHANTPITFARVVLNAGPAQSSPADWLL
jgi:hypothetical protein